MLTDLQRRIIAAMEPGIWCSANDLAEDVGWARAGTKFRRVLAVMVQAGLLRKSIVGKWAAAYVLTPQGVVTWRELRGVE